MGRSEPILHFSIIVGCRDRRPGDSKRLKSHPAGISVSKFPLIGSCTSISIRFPCDRSAGPSDGSGPEHSVRAPKNRPAGNRRRGGISTMDSSRTSTRMPTVGTCSRSSWGWTSLKVHQGGIIGLTASLKTHPMRPDFLEFLPIRAISGGSG